MVPPAAASGDPAVEVFYCRTASFDGPPLAAAAALLSSEERSRCANLALPAHRRDFVVAHALLRLAIAARTNVEPRRVRFGSDRHGKPFVAVDVGAAAPPQFSLSRGRGAIAIALVGGGAVGIDVEPIDAAADVLAVARRAFSAPEVASIEHTAPAARATRFFEIWTLREALLKAVGFGLAVPPDCASFDLRDGIITVTTAPPLPEEQWVCLVRPVAATHVMAIIASRLSGWRPISIVEVGADVFGDRAACGDLGHFTNAGDASMLPEAHSREA